MAPTATRQPTPLAAFLDSKTPHGLATFIAVHRMPGPAWKSFQEIADELTAISGYPVNRVSVKTFADDTYAIPDTRYTDGHKQPRPVSADVMEGYIRALDPARVDVEYVRENYLGEAAEAA